MHRSRLPAFLCSVATILIACFFQLTTHYSGQASGAPPNGIPESDVPVTDTSPWQNWQRPNVPPTVGLQVGHWKNDELPTELESLIGNTGATGGGVTEVELNLAIAESTAELLREEGIHVDILPATVPPDYWADVFMAIHADGSLDYRTSGFKVAGPWRDLTGNSRELVEIIETNYQVATNLIIDPNITRNMRGYYAFAWWKYEHSIHPMTTAVIMETGFLTSPSDRRVIVDRKEVVAQALATSIIEYLEIQEIHASV